MKLKYLVPIALILFSISILPKRDNYYSANKIISEKTYTVQSGDTLSQIATKYKPKDIRLANYIELIEYKNNIGSDIQVGQKIVIPIEK